MNEKTPIMFAYENNHQFISSISAYENSKFFLFVLKTGEALFIRKETGKDILNFRIEDVYFNFYYQKQELIITDTKQES